jgi:RNA polymerase sigma-70 factor (ECF subfamily)
MNTSIQALRLHEFEANAVLFRPYLQRLAQSLTHNRYDADDLVQETLTRAYRFRARFTPGTNMRAWLTRILKNSFINTRRLAARERRILDPVSLDQADFANQQMEPRDLDPSPEEQVIQGMLADRVEDLLAGLAEPYRSTLLLHLGDRTYREISRELGVPIGTVMSRLHRARGLLRAGLMGLS